MRSSSTFDANIFPITDGVISWVNGRLKKFFSNDFNWLPISLPIGQLGDAKIVSVNQNTLKISATLQIPKDSVAETFSVQLNSAPLVQNVKPKLTKSGVKFIQVVFPAKSLTSDVENLLTAIGDDASRYNYVLRRE